MKYLLLFFISFSVLAQQVPQTFKIQVFRKSDNKQMYGLYATNENRAKRLEAAMEIFDTNPAAYTLVNEDITAELQAEADKKRDRITEIRQLKRALNVIDNSNLEAPIKKILKRLVKELPDA